jgi:CarD family transcriptional regulator
MLLTTGSIVVYPSQGPCLIGPTIERIIEGRALMFYQLVVLNGGADLFVPVDKVAAVGIRPLFELSEIPGLLEHLTRSVSPIDDHRQRSLYILKRFASGSAHDLAEVASFLTELNLVKALSFGESKTLERAKGLLACEIAEVLGTSREAATEWLESALDTRTRQAQACVSANRRAGSGRNQPGHPAVSG